MIYTIIAFLGCVLGYLTANFTKEELKPGIIYFKILQLIILLLIPIVSLYYSFNLVLLLAGFLVGLAFRFEYLYFGIGIFSNVNFNLDFLSSALVFVYGLPYGSLVFYNKNLKHLFYSFILFFLPLTVYFFRYDLTSFAAGGLLAVFCLKITKFFR